MAHAQTIENCDRHDAFPHELSDAYRTITFGSSKVFKDKKEAILKAHEIADDITGGGFPLEYGVITIDYEADFPKITKEEAAQLLADCWGKHDATR